MAVLVQTAQHGARFGIAAGGGVLAFSSELCTGKADQLIRLSFLRTAPRHCQVPGRRLSGRQVAVRPARAASIPAMSMRRIVIMASIARFAAARSGSFSAASKARGTICQ